MANAGEVEPIPVVPATLGEGAIWNAAVQCLQWIDIIGQRVFTYDPATSENRGYDVGQKVGTVVPRAHGGLMLALQEGFASFDADTGRVALLPRPRSTIRRSSASTMASAIRPGVSGRGRWRS